MEGRAMHTEYLLHIESTWEEGEKLLGKCSKQKLLRQRSKKNKKRGRTQREYDDTTRTGTETATSKNNYMYKSNSQVMKDIASGEKYIKRKVCNKQFNISDSSESRLIGETEVNMDTCGSSEKALNLNVGLVRHTETYIGERLYKCTKCPKGFRVRRNLIDHIMTHTCDIVTPTNQTNIQGRQTSYQSTVSRINVSNLSTYTNVGREPEAPLRCSSCGMEFKAERDLASHTKTHRAGKSYSCSVCDKIFFNKLTFLYHTLLHTDGEPRKCHVCGMEFADESDLRKHRRSHRTGKSYKCTVCDKVFAHKLAFLYHAMDHKADGPHKCTVCGIEFAENEDLSKHTRTHRLTKSYKCSLCNEMFCKKLDLLYHTVEHSNEGMHVHNT